MTTTRLLTPARALQQPQWASLDRLRAVLDDLEGRPALVHYDEVELLRRDLALAAAGAATVLQIGDCAELFADTNPAAIDARVALLDTLATTFEAATALPAIRVGRLAGQYAKPRSQAFEQLPDGRLLPVYRGDAVNSSEPTLEARRANPDRLTRAYDCAATIVNQLDRRRAIPGVEPLYTSHEALLLEYESALLRLGAAECKFGASGHMLWIGERTRQLDHGHVRFATEITNPVGVKVGPTARAEDLVRLAAVLNPADLPGRLTFIVRMGARRIAERLPQLVNALPERVRAAVVWMCDPMHGNTLLNNAGQKTRVITDVLDEVDRFCAVLREQGVAVGGVHLETSPDDVNECTPLHDHLGWPLEAYDTLCDPRLNPSQAHTVIERLASWVAG